VIVLIVILIVAVDRRANLNTRFGYGGCLVRGSSLVSAIALLIAEVMMENSNIGVWCGAALL
jgi:hypothetical protein